MKKNISKAIVAATGILLSVSAFAGNKDRSGQAGASQLLINPWAGSTGVFGLNSAYVQGVEAMKGNVAGLAYLKGTEFGFSYGEYLRGTNVAIQNLAFAQQLGDLGVVGVNLQSLNFGNIPSTSFDFPDGGNGSYKPSFFNIQVGFAKEFKKSIHAGVAVTYVSEAISNIRASGATFDAGVYYSGGGERYPFHFGVTLRNVGTNMRYTGEGFAINTEVNDMFARNVQTPSEKYEMPTYLNIGTSYDFFLDAANTPEDATPKHRLSPMFAFTSNSFNNDYLGLGLEYAFRQRVMLRAAYRYEKDIFSYDNRTTIFTGLSAGAGVALPFGKAGSKISIDYSFRPTKRPDNGVHLFSVKLNLAKKASEVEKED